MTDEENTIVDAIYALSRSVGRIASGGEQPDGLEALAMALAGDGLRHPIGEALENIATAISELASVLDRER